MIKGTGQSNVRKKEKEATARCVPLPPYQPRHSQHPPIRQIVQSVRRVDYILPYGANIEQVDELLVYCARLWRGEAAISGVRAVRVDGG